MVPAPEAWSKSRANWFWVITAYASGVAMVGVLTPTVVVPPDGGLSAGALATAALAGNVVGLFTLNTLWSRFARRWLAMVTFVGMAVSAVWTAWASTGTGYLGAACALGLAGSTWPSMLDRVGEATEEYLAAHPRNGLTVGFVVELVVFGGVFVIASVLAVQTELMRVSVVAASLVGVPLAVAGAVGVLLSWPKERVDRELPTARELLLGPLLAFRYGVGRWLVASGASVGLLLALFDNFWREIPGISAGWQSTVGYGMVVGGLLPVIIEKVGHRGDGGGFVDSRPGRFAVLMGALVFGSGLSVLIGGVLIPTVAALAVASTIHEAGSSGLIPGWQGLIRQNVPEAHRCMVLAGVTLAKTVFQFLGGLLGTLIWSGALGVLPAGWDGIRYAMFTVGVVALGVLVATAARYERGAGTNRLAAFLTTWSVRRAGPGTAAGMGSGGPTVFADGAGSTVAGSFAPSTALRRRCWSPIQARAPTPGAVSSPRFRYAKGFAG